MATTFAVPDGRVAMAATTYTGTGATLAVSNAVNSVSFQPDFVWMKGRSGATDHALYDSVRGTTLDLVSNSTAAETTQTTGLTTFGAAGFTVGALAKVNTSAATYVGWQWNAGGTTVTNGVGTISSQVRANTDAGFSVVTYTGNGTGGATIGHGLGVTPGLVIVKNRSIVIDWPVYHSSIASGSTMWLNLTTAQTPIVASTNNGGVGAVSATTFTCTNGIVNSSSVNGSGNNIVAYCWAPVAGYSAFGSYTGNGSADGPFIYTGFRPRFILIKVSSTTGNWRILDTARSPSNVESLELYPSLANAESSFAILDGLSNGFKIRNSDVNYNNSGSTYIYAAFAENPLKYANAR